MLTQDRLMEVLDYDPETGIFTWQIQPGSRSDMVGKRAGYYGPGRYRSITVDGVGYLEHRLAWLFVHGRFPPDQMDHINRNRSDNRLENLREATRSQNQRNRLAYSGLKGCWWHSRDRRWIARCGTTNLGSFHTEKEAYEAYCEAAKVKYGEFFNAG